MKKQIISVGIPINNGTNLYPMVKDEKTTIIPIKTIAKDGVEIWGICLKARIKPALMAFWIKPEEIA